MIANSINWIWNIRGSLALPVGQTREQAFDQLDPLFEEQGTTHLRTADSLSFTKKDQAAQDRMSIFDAGVLWIEQGASGLVLRYQLTSRALLFCFLAPLLFLTFAGLNVVVAQYEAAPGHEAEKDKKDEDKVLEQNPIDKFLGAPAPEKPKKDDAEKDEDKGPKPTSGYVFAGIFAVLYLVGRVLEDWLIKRAFRTRLIAS